MKIYCLFCDKLYNVNIKTTIIDGIYIITTCPFCNNRFQDKIINYLDGQVNKICNISKKPKFYRVIVAQQIIQRLEMILSQLPLNKFRGFHQR